ncbi:MAG: T9SS type A sorting domain-containing protein [Bacteroidetes bacterium]|nr:T9SS type A sorting domain-containing protein [Bacteroidota bacterium]
MRRSVLILFLMTFAICSNGQNLISNGGFENYSACPTATSMFGGYCTGWSSYTNGTPDYYNSCAASATGVSTPANINGTQAAANGNAYCGIVDYAGNVDFKEYIETGISTLQAGATYTVSMYVSLADNAGFASNGLGMFFFKNGPASIASTNKLNTTPQVSFSAYGPLTNKSGWTKLEGSFVADSAYDHVVIGGFKDNSSIQITNMPSGTLGLSYYYIDSVMIKAADTVSFIVMDTTLCAGDKVNIDYTVNAAVAFNSSNTFTLQLSDNLGAFTSPVSIGTASATSSGTIQATIPVTTVTGGLYRMRIVSSSPYYVSAISDVSIGIGGGKPQPNLHITSPVCERDTFTLSVTAPGPLTDAIWNGPGLSNSHAASITVFHAKTANAGIYTVDVFNYGCEAHASGSLQVISKPARPIGTSNSPVCSGSTLQLNGTGAGTSWAWKDALGNIYSTKDTTIHHILAADSGLYILTTFQNGCSASDTVHVFVKETPIPRLFTNNPCAGDTLFVASQYKDSGAIFQWNGPSGYTSAQKIVTIPGVGQSSAGSYSVSITGSNGCVGIDSIQAVVKDLPPSTTITGNIILCEQDTLVLKAANTAPGVSYHWYGPHGTNISDNTIIIPGVTNGASGIYYVEANLDNCIRKDSTSVTVNHTPEQPVVAGDAELQAGESLHLFVSNVESGTTYHWSGPHNFTASGTEVAIENIGRDQEGTYIVNATDGNCSSSAITLVKINEAVNNTGLQIFPNANDGDFFIKCTTKYDNKIQVVLRNSTGQVVFRQDFLTINNSLLQNIRLRGRLASGTYMITVIVDGVKLSKILSINRM